MKKLFKKIKPHDQDQKDTIIYFNKWYVELCQNLKGSVGYDAGSPASIMSYQFNCGMQLFLYRIIDLIEELSHNCERNNYSAAILILRASMEVTAMIYDLTKKIKYKLDQEEYDEIHELIASRIFGSRNNPPFFKSVNVLTCIDNVTKVYGDYKSTYEELSDYCHPSYKNLFNFYGEMNKEKNVVVFNKKTYDKRFHFGLIVKPLFNIFDVYRDVMKLTSDLDAEILKVNWKIGLQTNS